MDEDVIQIQKLTNAEKHKKAQGKKTGTTLVLALDGLPRLADLHDRLGEARLGSAWLGSEGWLVSAPGLAERPGLAS